MVRDRKKIALEVQYGVAIDLRYWALPICIRWSNDSGWDYYAIEIFCFILYREVWYI